MINIPKGTKDVLPSESYKWQYIEKKARETAAKYNFKEIRTPTFEDTGLFLRGVGETTDVVCKEMYTFKDKGDRSITLKPEGTAGVARSFIENGMSSGVLPVKAYYIIPAFRYERPQAGRLREFHQFGVEFFGSSSADADAETIMIADSLLKELGIKADLQINSIGCPDCRKNYNTALKEYFAPHLNELCADCKSRFEKNPLRLLDCKEENCRKINANAPKILDYLCPECKEHFDTLKSYLDIVGIPYSINPRIVRGLDYYTRTVFEFVVGGIGAQSTICGGGRYDGLIKELGGNSTPAVGFAAGIERLLLAIEESGATIPEEETIDLYLAGMDDNTRKKAFQFAATLRRANISAECDHMQRSIKAQFKYANKLGAKYVIVLGETELESGLAKLKNMQTGEEVEVSVKTPEEFMNDFLLKTTK